MFYFKEEPISPSDIDSEQLAKVQAFRKELGSTSIYGTFVTADDLGRLVRIHLTRHLLGNLHTSSADQSSLEMPKPSLNDGHDSKQGQVSLSRMMKDFSILSNVRPKTSPVFAKYSGA
jgi:hypothetical protein